MNIKTSNLMRQLSFITLHIFLITTIFDGGNLAFAITLGSGSTSSGSVSAQLGNLQESAGPVRSFQTDLFTGRAQTSIPIFIPPGRKNIQPNLNLSYSSSGGNSWLGTGWSLDLGFIQRDLKRGAPKYNSSDKFVFSFQGVYSELVSVGTNEYRAKDEALFLKFLFDPVSNSWTVTDKSGTKHYFGETSSSRIEFTGKGTFKWALSKLKDTSGNYLSVTYTADQGELYLASIDYNGNETQAFAHTHRAEFSLENRSDLSLSFIAGGRQVTAKRLKEIQVKVKDTGGVYQLARKYALAYEVSLATQRSRLKTVTECGKDGITCLPAVTFTYQDKPLEFLPFGNFSGVKNDPYVGVKGSFMRNGRSDASNWINTWADTVDLDGDSLPDRIQRKETNGKWAMYRNNKSSNISLFDPAAEISDIATVENISQGYYSRAVSDQGATQVEMIDLNGDGLSDRVMSLGSTLNTWYWQKNLGGSFAVSQSITPILSADGSTNQYKINYTTTTSPFITFAELTDMNGDGLLDRAMRIGTDTDKWKVQWGSLDAQGKPTFNTALTDFPGIQIPTGGAESQRNIRSYYTTGAGFRVAEAELIDMNGDGLPDRVMNDPANNLKWKVQFNNGSSFEPIEDWTPIENLTSFTGAEYYKMRAVSSSGLTHVDLVDINSDGLPDRVLYNNSTSWFVQYNKGNGFHTSLTLSGIQNPTANTNYNYMRMAESSTGDQGVDLLDLDGDGLIDRLISEEGASSWYIQRGKGPYPDLLSQIDNGRGGKTAIAYSPSTLFDNKDTSGVHRLPFVVHVVSEVRQEDGMGSSVITSYAYKGGMYDATNREFRGFREVTVTDAVGTTTVHTFGQDDHKKGRLLEKQVKDSSGNLFTKEVTTWDDTHPYTGVHFVFVSQQDNYVYDGNGTNKQTRQTFTYDSYGNLASTTEEGDTGVSTDSRKTVNTYVYNTTDYILNTLSKTTHYDTDLTTVKAERYFYYDGATSITTAPTKGLLTKEEEWLNTTGCTTPQTGCSTSPTTVMAYDSCGNLTSVTDPRGYQTSNDYDTTYKLFLIKITNTLTHTREFTYDPWLAQILTSKDQNGQTTETQYDALGRVTKVIAPLDSSTEPTQEFAYDLSSVPNKTTTKIKSSVPGQTFTQLITYTFVDGVGREIQKRSPAEDSQKQIVASVVEFDSRGQVKKQWHPFFDDTSTSYRTPTQMGTSSKPNVQFIYDPVGRRTRIDYPDGTNSQTAYDDFVKTTTDQRGKQLRYTNDAYGRLTKVEEFNSGSTYTTTYEYDVFNNLKKTTDNAGNETTVTYDSLSRKTAMTDPDLGSWSYVYDKNDNLTSQTDAKSQTISFTYDALNRVTLKDLPTPETDVTYSYDSAPSGYSGQTGYWVGRLAKVTDASGTHEFLYDKLGRVLKDKKTVDSTAYEFVWAYDSLGRVRTLTYPDTEVVTYTFNGFGDLETISGVKNSVTTDYIKDVNYNASGQVTFTKYGNNVTSDYTYNANTLRLSNILTKKPDGTTKLQDLSYTFDGNGNVTRIADVVNSMTQDFTYDDLNRLTQAVGSAYGTQTFAYSSIGNMTTKGNLSLSYTNTSHDHAVSSVSWSTGQGPSYCQSSPCSYTYDANGNMSGRGSDTLSYDSENRLKEITAYEGTTNTQQYTLKPGWNVVSFTWLPDNKLVSNILSTLTFGTDYDQVSTWDSASSSWKHWVNDPDFNDFTEFQRGKTYEIYNKTAGDLTFSVTGKSSGPNISHSIVSGDNFISPAVKTATNVTTVLSSLTYGTHYSDVKRFNATSQTWESYASSQFTQFEPGKGYNIIGLTSASFSYGETVQTTSFVYDSTGSRVKKTAGSTTTIYLGKDYEVEGSTFTKHLFLGDRRISTKKYDGSTHTTEYIHGDHINSSNIITDSSGNQSGLLEYDPYGTTVTQTGSANPKHKFTGQEEDSTTHLYAYGAPGRYYDPQIGRFITADPFVQKFSDPQALNRYAYARNNPIIFTDPTGHFFWFIAAAIKAIIDIAAAAASWAATFASSFAAAYGSAASAIGAAAGLKGTLALVVGHAVLGASYGAILGTADAAINGRSIGKAAATGAIGGAITGGIVGPGGEALSAFISDKMSMGVVMGIARVGLGSYQAYSSIKNQNYFSGAFAAVNTLATATIVADKIYTTVADPHSPEHIVANKTIQAEFERAWKDADAYNGQKRHEEGGWIRKELFGKLDVDRWPPGGSHWIQPTVQPRNAIAEFHVHPNYRPGMDTKGPSGADIRAVKDNGLHGFIVDVESYLHYDGSGQWQEIRRR